MGLYSAEPKSGSISSCLLLLDVSKLYAVHDCSPLKARTDKRVEMFGHKEKRSVSKVSERQGLSKHHL